MTIVLIQEVRDGVLLSPIAYSTEAEAQDEWNSRIPTHLDAGERGFLEDEDRITDGGVECFRWRVEL